MSNKRFILTRSSSFSEWLKYLNSLNINIINYNLKNVIYIAKKLNLLNLKAFVFIVGGTNGKGTTCYFLEKLLLALGYQVGLYTSPHLICYTERIRINGMELEKDVYVSAFNTIEKIRESIVLTQFEFITLSALFLFNSIQLDIIILEVGIGGRLDATNIVNSDMSIITSIALDHIDILGCTRELISIEKSGIFRYKKFSIISENNVPSIIFKIAKQKNTILRVINRDWAYKKHITDWSFTSDKLSLFNLPLPKVHLNNTATALSAIIESGISIHLPCIKKCIVDFTCPGRCQIISYNPVIILDVAHNRHATQNLLKEITILKKSGKIYAIVGILKDKNVKDIIQPLLRIIDFWFCVTLNTNRSLTAQQIKKYLFTNAKACVNVSIAWYEVQKIVKYDDIIVIFGSFFTVRAAYELLKDKLVNI